MRANFIHKCSKEVFIHFFAWVILFGITPMLLGHNNELQETGDYIRMMTQPVALGIIFYINYLYLVPHYLLRKRYNIYVTANACLCLGMLAAVHIWFEQCNIYFPEPENVRPRPNFGFWSFFFFRIRDLIIYGFTAALGATIRMSQKWRAAEIARQKAELKRTEAELKNLRNQINPHFLLNTLNNIYALIAFDTQKAQQAVQDLSRLLRHALYDNNLDYIPIQRELEFLKNYVALMRIRLPEDTDIRFETNLPEDKNILIAPLIYISLIENAFKHGISPLRHSFIHIKLYWEEPGQLTLHIENSNFPKKSNDISGSGIGLEQVKRRLELLYPGKYQWRKGTNDDQTVYSSLLTIETKLP